MAKKEMPVTISFYLDRETRLRMARIVETGILGPTFNDVAVHMMRQFVFEAWVKGELATPSAEPASAAPRKVPSRAAGGKARAKKLTPEGRKAIAKAVSEQWRARKK